MDWYLISGIEGTVAVVCRDGGMESLKIVISGLGVDINTYIENCLVLISDMT